MKVIKRNVSKDYVSCNFCSRGNLHPEIPDFHYPYTDVYEFVRDSGSGITAAICKDCAHELVEKIKTLA
jgi:hypothetical protein